MKQSYDVIIIGGGITAASAAEYISKDSQLSAVRCVSTKITATSFKAPAYGCGGSWDNYTRISHAHGPDGARDMWRFGNEGYDGLVNFCEEEGIRLSHGQRFRYLNGPGEAEEAAKAVAQLQAQGFPVTLTKPPWDKADVNSVQTDGPSCLIPKEPLFARLGEPVPTIKARVQELKPHKDGVSVALTSGDVLQGQMVILGTHLSTGELIPELNEVFISFADQWERVTVANDSEDIPVGSVISMNHTYEWGTKIAPKEWAIGGGRYLRHMAGIEAPTAEFDDDIAQKTTHKFTSLLGLGPYKRLVDSGRAFLGCRPCDELPVVGPMFGDGRILLGAGYMQNGLSCGFLAGKCLAELVRHGKADSLPRAFWPERQRSLGEQS